MSQFTKSKNEIEEKPRIQVSFPSDRSKNGLLVYRDADGKILAGPFLACGKADGLIARKKGNPERSTILLYGDTTKGGYRVSNIFSVGEGTVYSKRS